MENYNQTTPIVMLTVGELKKLIAGSILLPTAKPIRENIGLEEVEEMTGYKKPTIYKLVSKRQIPFHKPEHGGKMLVFKRSEIEEWMAAKSTPTLISVANNALKRK